MVELWRQGRGRRRNPLVGTFHKWHIIFYFSPSRPGTVHFVKKVSLFLMQFLFSILQVSKPYGCCLCCVVHRVHLLVIMYSSCVVFTLCTPVGGGCGEILGTVIYCMCVFAATTTSGTDAQNTQLTQVHRAREIVRREERVCGTRGAICNMGGQQKCCGFFANIVICWAATGQFASGGETLVGEGAPREQWGLLYLSLRVI